MRAKYYNQNSLFKKFSNAYIEIKPIVLTPMGTLLTLIKA
jgi:hypothetical protein